MGEQAEKKEDVKSREIRESSSSGGFESIRIRKRNDDELELEVRADRLNSDEGA